MKKYLMGTIAIILALAFSAFTTSNPVKDVPGVDPLYWYEVESGFTAGPYVQTGTKLTVIGNQDCKDEGEDICLFGSEDNDLDHYPVAGFTEANSIMTSDD